MSREILEKLKKFRSELSLLSGLEPFKIFHNSTLEEISEKKPKNLEELKAIKGLGEKKIARFGVVILEILWGKNVQEKKENFFTVAEYLRQVNRSLQLQRVILEGEVVGRISGRDSYTYFTLQDVKENALLVCFCWNSVLQQLGIELKEGMLLKIEGFGRIWEPKGTFNFQVQNVLLSGEGELKKAFDLLKSNLEKQGLFDAEFKKIIPRFPKNIGIITSERSDAYADFQRHLISRGIYVFVHDVKVEGMGSSDQIERAIQYFNSHKPHMDLIVLTRGGGSLESLQSFNSEKVARAIFASRIPTLCGVGHERDVTIADMVSDKRASTPTDAAKIINEIWLESEYQLERMRTFFENSIQMSFSEYQKRLQRHAGRLQLFFTSFFQKYRVAFQNFRRSIQIFSLRLADTKKDIQHGKQELISTFATALRFRKEYIENAQTNLAVANPEMKLKQGYSIVRCKKDHKIIRSAQEIQEGDSVELQFSSGKADTIIQKRYGNT